MVSSSEAAVRSGMHVQMVHAWCRSGRVKAVKGRTGWDIDPESLTAHLDYTEALVTSFLHAGGTEWRRNGRYRVYLSEKCWQDWSGLVFTKHDGGRPNSATLDRRPIVDSNGGTGKLGWAVTGRVYFDAAHHTLVLPGTPDLILALPAVRADGDRAEFVIELAARICTGAAASTGLDFGTPISIRIGHGSHDFALAIPVTASPLEAP